MKQTVEVQAISRVKAKKTEESSACFAEKVSNCHNIEKENIVDNNAVECTLEDDLDKSTTDPEKLYETKKDEEDVFQPEHSTSSTNCLSDGTAQWVHWTQFAVDEGYKMEHKSGLNFK